MITKRQKEYLTFMYAFFKKNDQLPPMSLLAEKMGVAQNAAQEMMLRLEYDGHIKRNAVGKWKWADRKIPTLPEVDRLIASQHKLITDLQERYNSLVTENSKLFERVWHLTYLCRVNEILESDIADTALSVETKH